ncbi:uncharacterized protein CTRU02_208506 [Colletotrichum truncatum]|uniref:Uncharacterized protein n=1 Tax=Colletotrichum truncatum TaxID=5467 RepID=A0ACC3YXT5_COLTU|nr:uncharacterized protein CTRU02_10261 [Colletotrichum truncatum]KAF6787465.1 hypothetical protein CTRU02_10261 [Colletotrichum truncatum]
MKPEMRIPPGPYSPSTHPHIPMENLQVGCLYLMISVPLRIYIGRKQHTYSTDLPSGQEIDYSTYELGVSDGHLTEEFHWDLYWHTSNHTIPAASSSNKANIANNGSGILYRLRSLGSYPKTYVCDRIPVIRVRTHSQLVGLVRVISVPVSVVPHLTRYLDWMTKESAGAAKRSYVWATMAYYRTRAHLAKGNGVQDHSFNQFDVSRFTAEVLSFAYKNVPQLIHSDASEMSLRPVIASWMGITLGFLDDDDIVATIRKRDELLRRQKEEFGAVSACWYH